MPTSPMPSPPLCMRYFIKLVPDFPRLSAPRNSYIQTSLNNRARQPISFGLAPLVRLPLLTRLKLLSWPFDLLLRGSRPSLPYDISPADRISSCHSVRFLFPE